MWNARLSRKELIELVLGARRPDGIKLQHSTGVTLGGSPDAIHVFWESDPRIGIALPNLIVVPDDSDTELFVALNASPQAPTPITALSRVLIWTETQDLFGGTLFDSREDVLPITVALAMAEAVMLSDGRLPLRNVTPAACKRTLSYAWGKALNLRVPASALVKLPTRWLDTYAMVGGSAPPSSVQSIIGALVTPLSACAHISSGIPLESVAGKLAGALVKRDRLAIELAWRDFAPAIDTSLTLEEIAYSPREERGMHLHRALKAAESGGGDERTLVACAFLATQVAPNSLEHLEVLRTGAHPAVAFWYAMFAAMQSRSELLSGNGGVGLRVLRDVARIDGYLARPNSDIAYAELKALERVGIDGLARKFGHLGEVEVELVPLVTSSFSFQTRLSRERAERERGELGFEFDHNAGRRELPTKARLQKALAAISDLVRELPDKDDSGMPGKRGGAIGGRRPKTGRDES